MKHLLSFSVYQDLHALGSDPRNVLESIGCDGLELLTGYSEPDGCFRDFATAVHLPFAPDWLAAWEDRPVDAPEEMSLYHMYGRSREELIENVRRSILCASSLSPPYGVFHACNADTDEIFLRRYSRSDSYVQDALCEMMNTVVSSMPGSEPPFRIAFENLWWPGLRMTDGAGVHTLEHKLEFDNWGICLDTGHLMSCLPVHSQEEAIEAVLDTFDSYSRDVMGRIGTVHFHWSASGTYRETFQEREMDRPFEDFIAEANAHVQKIDRHLPFSDPRCSEILDVLSPDYVTHEMTGPEQKAMEAFRKQRSLLP